MLIDDPQYLHSGRCYEDLSIRIWGKHEDARHALHEIGVQWVGIGKRGVSFAQLCHDEKRRRGLRHLEAYARRLVKKYPAMKVEVCDVRNVISLAARRSEKSA